MSAGNNELATRRQTTSQFTDLSSDANLAASADIRGATIVLGDESDNDSVSSRSSENRSSSKPLVGVQGPTMIDGASAACRPSSCAVVDGGNSSSDHVYAEVSHCSERVFISQF